MIADAGVYDFAVAPRPDPRARRVQALADRAAPEPQGRGRTGPRAPGQARGEGRERRHAHEVAPGAPSRPRGLEPAGRAPGARALRTARGHARRCGRAPTPSPVAPPPRACAGAARGARVPTRAAPRCRRRSLAAPAAPGPREIAVDRRGEPGAHRSPRRSTRTVQCSWYGNGAWITTRATLPVAERVVAVDLEGTEPRPPFAVPVGAGERRPEFGRAHAEVPRPIEAER